MSLLKLAPLLLLPALSTAQSLTPAEALERHLSRSSDQRPACSHSVYAVDINASLPKLKKQGTMQGFKLVSQTGQVVYRGLRFTGDNLVKTAVIARFLANGAETGERTGDTVVTRRNYYFAYDKTAGYNGMTAYVFRLRPKHKRVGLFKGELWLDASTAASLRLWGDFVKSPSVFVRSFRFVLDYQNLNCCSQPLRVLLQVQTRIAGDAEMAVWLHPVDSSSAPSESIAGGEPGVDGGSKD